MRVSMISAALVAALVGYGSTIALVLAAAAAVGATPAQSASWLLAVCLAKAIGSAALSARSRVPVVLAWSTPGAALIAATTGITMAEAAGAFLLAGGLIALTGAVRPLGRLIAAIPDGIAAGMLAGVLLPLVLRLGPAVASDAAMILPPVAVFVAIRLWNPSLAVLAALAAAGTLAFLGPATLPDLTPALPRLTLIAPEFRPAVLIGLGLPLYLVTMASQNLPGFATLRAAGYEPPVRLALMTTGALSAVAALFGAHTVSMAAITAAICLGDDVDPDRTTRWRVGLAYAACWVGLGLFGPVIVLVIAAMPAAILTAIVALALLGPLTGALTQAFATPAQWFPAAATLIVTASGLTLAGIGAAFWGLLAGLILWGLDRAVTAARGR